MQVSASCPNRNHGRKDAPVRCCPSCGEVVNGIILARKCTEDEHARRRRDMNKYCVNCGEQLIQDR